MEYDRIKEAAEVLETTQEVVILNSIEKRLEKSNYYLNWIMLSVFIYLPLILWMVWDTSKY
jgi:hypothetical protein